jgi:hypothetical protein
MNNAKNKMTEEAAAKRGWKPVERDAMPCQVATDYLCQFERMTNRQRKNYLDARCRVFESVLVPKPREAKLADRMAGATLVQLGHWNSRSAKKRRGLQTKYEAALRLKQTPLVARVIAALNLATKVLDAVIDTSEEELKWRAGLVQGNSLPGATEDTVGGHLLVAWNGKPMLWIDGSHYRARYYPRWVCVPKSRILP